MSNSERTAAAVTAIVKVSVRDLNPYETKGRPQGLYPVTRCAHCADHDQQHPIHNTPLRRASVRQVIPAASLLTFGRNTGQHFSRHNHVRTFGPFNSRKVNGPLGFILPRSRPRNSLSEIATSTTVRPPMLTLESPMFGIPRKPAGSPNFDGLLCRKPSLACVRRRLSAAACAPTCTLRHFARTGSSATGPPQCEDTRYAVCTVHPPCRSGEPPPRL